MQAEARATIITHGIATAALVVVVVLFVFSSFMTHHYAGWWWAALKAFSEAATVGALADWFAVVALFRHPLGLLIPHTAVLVKKQDSIAKSIASFFCDNFWVPDQVRARLLTLQPASAFVKAAGQQNGALSSLLTGLRRTLAEQLRNRAAISQLSDALTKLLPSLPLADAVRGLVRAVEKSQLPSAAVEMMVNEAATYVNTHRTDIRQEVIACFRAAKPSIGKGAGTIVGDIAGFVGDVVDTTILPIPDIDSLPTSGKRSFFGNVLEKVAGNAARSGNSNLNELIVRSCNAIKRRSGSYKPNSLVTVPLLKPATLPNRFLPWLIRKMLSRRLPVPARWWGGVEKNR